MKIIVVCGPTAVGKTKYAIEISKAFNSEIISCDSMQIYKYMDIGSAKPTTDEQNQIKHHLVDYVDPRVEYSVSDYQKDAMGIISNLSANSIIPVISGGTGLFLNSILYDMDFNNFDKDEKLRETLNEKSNEELYKMLLYLDKKSAVSIHINNKKKLIRAIELALNGESLGEFKSIKKNDNIDAILIGLTRNRDELYSRIDSRVNQMFELGLVSEVKELKNIGLTFDDISMKGIGYKEVFQYLNNEISYEEMIDVIKKNTRHYAKRQLTWFKRYSDMKWFNLSEYEEDNAINEIIKYIKENI